MRETIKWWLFPGTNLNARLRYRLIPKFLKSASTGEKHLILDAGCGNGALAYQSFRLGNRVLGVSIKDEVVRNQHLFNQKLRIPQDRLEFRNLNLYSVADLGKDRFDEIVCTEVLEHIRGDKKVVQAFYEILKPGGTLHVCCPNSEHPYHKAYPLDPDETGGHVRSGYTEETYRELLELAGFRITTIRGVGGFWRHRGNEWIRAVERLGGVPAGVIAFLLIWPVSLLDKLISSTPFSLYVQAVKPLKE